MSVSVLLIAVLGLAVGSFLNVCIYRLPRGRSIVWPASRCTSCSRALGWYENIPIVSYTLLAGRCRTCHAAISPIYPAVELLTAVVFVLTLAQTGVGWLLVARLVFGCAMIVLAFIDLQHRILPNTITVPGIALGFLFSFVGPPGWVSSLVGIVAGGGSLLLIAWAYERVRRQQGLGMGDVKMLAMIGAFLGWQLMLLTLVVASVMGSLVGMAMVVAGRGHMKYALPLGTFLAIGAILASLTGDAIIAWYMSFY